MIHTGEAVLRAVVPPIGPIDQLSNRVGTLTRSSVAGTARSSQLAAAARGMKLNVELLNSKRRARPTAMVSLPIPIQYINLGKSSNSRGAGVASDLPALASTSSICAVMCGTMRLLPRHGQGCTARPAERPFQTPKEHALATACAAYATATILPNLAAGHAWLYYTYGVPVGSPFLRATAQHAHGPAVRYSPSDR